MIKRGYIPVSQEVKDSIQFQEKRTGIGPQKLLRGNKEAKQIGLTSGIIYSWTNGRSKTCKQVHFDLCIKLWEDLPDKGDILPKKPKNPYQQQREKHRNELIGRE